MVSELFFYEFVLFGLLWLCIMLHYAWPSDRPVWDQRPSKPPKPPRERSRDSKPFPGLTHKPCCVACEPAAQQPAVPPPPAPPPPITSTRGRPRQVDTSQHFCPNPDCTYQGRVGLGNLSANGHPGGGPWRQLHCSACEGYVLETHGTIFHGKRVAVELIVRVLACLAEGLGIRGTARVFEVGARTLPMAQCFVHQVAQVLAPGCVPLFLTDGFKEYTTALLAHFGHWVQPARRQAKGPAPKPRWMPLPQLLYAQVVKVTRRRRLVEVKHRVVFGTKAAVEQVLAACGWRINTAFIEVRPVGRKEALASG